MNDERSLPAGLPEMLREAIARLEEADRELDREIAAEHAQNDEARAGLAARARKGELGPEWQRVQTRIDSGETTLEAVFSGEDDSPAARTLRERSRANLKSLADEWRDHDEADDLDEEPSPAALASKGSAESAARFQAAAEQIADALARLDRGRLGARR